MLRQQINKLAFVNKDGAKFTKPKLVLTSKCLSPLLEILAMYTTYQECLIR